MVDLFATEVLHFYSEKYERWAGVVDGCTKNETVVGVYKDSRINIVLVVVSFDLVLGTHLICPIVDSEQKFRHNPVTVL